MRTITIPKELHSNEVLTMALTHQGSGWAPDESGRGTLLETGPQKVLLNKLIALIDQSKEMICFQSFLMQEGPLFAALKRAASRGVRVYALGAAEARLANHNEEEEDFMKEHYIKLLEETFKGSILFRTADYFHAKYLLIDPESNAAAGFLVTCNLTNKALSENPELGLQLNPIQIKELFEIFVYHFWEHAAHQHGKSAQFDAVAPAKRFAPKPWTHVRITSPNPAATTLLPSLLEAVEKATKSIVVSAFGFESEHALCQAILKKAKDGMEVIVFSPPRKPNLDGFCKQIEQAGGIVISQNLLHAKFLVTDNHTAYVFTANFAKLGLDSGMEVGILLSKEQTVELNALITRWKKDFQFRLRIDSPIRDLGIGKLSLLGSDGKPIEKEIRESIDIQMKKTLSKVSDLRTVIEDFKSKEPERNAIKTNLVLKLEAPNLPETINREAVAPGVLIVTIKEKAGSRPGIQLTEDFQVDSLDKIDAKWNNWPIFI